ncbi:TlpA family protein disulfide reductase [Pseudoxanthomonas beigongshangi]
MRVVPLLLLATTLVLSACKPSTPAEDPAGPTAPAPASGPAPATDAGNGMAIRETTAEIPTLAVDTVDGGRFDLSAHRGKWVVVNFWATWCAPCLKEMPELSALDAMREDVQVVGLAYEDITPADMQAFLKEHPVVYPIAIIDVMAPPADFATPRGLPTTYLIAPDGKVAKAFAGPVTAHDLETLIASSAKPG